MQSLREKIIAFIKSEKEAPVNAAVASGLFPLLYYYYSNFTLLNSWEQFAFFIVYFLAVPIALFKISHVLVNSIAFFKPARYFVLPILNLGWSAYLLVIITKGFNLKYILLVVLLAIFFGVLLRNYLKKIIVFQFLLALVIIFSLWKYVFFDIQYPEEWMAQPDDIEGIVFKKTPNIYIIQPDGYVNFSEIGKGHYQYNNSEFRNFLLEKEFQVYDNYRSNYYSTLSSNSSMFAMKHHYYNFPSSKIREVFNARNIITGGNPVINILEQNNYKTHLLMEKSYLLTNRPEMHYDYCNINYDEFTYFSRGFHVTKDVGQDLEKLFPLQKDKPNFFFIEQLLPGHITNKSSPKDIADSERDKYFDKLQAANKWLKNIINFIIKNDPDGLIVITADHGGFVGMNTTLEARSKLTDRDLIYSIFTAQLAVKWPNNIVPNYDSQIKTPVNLFRILFSYLSENERYLENLQEDKSYIPITNDAPFGIYEYINEKGDVTFNKVSKN